MDKIKTVKIKNPDGSISEETYTISVDAKDVDMQNGKDLQDTIGNINIDTDGNITEQLTILNQNKENVNNNLIELNNNIKKKIYYFDTVANMQNANLKNGDYVYTSGYYTIDDGGNAEYTIVNNIGNEQVDNMFYIRLTNSLIAKLIIKPDFNIQQLGASTSLSDNSGYISAALDKTNYAFVPNGDWPCASQIILKAKQTIEGQDKNHTILRYSGEDAFITNEDLSTTNYITIRNLTLVGTSKKGYGIYLIRTQKSGDTWHRLKDLYIRNFNYGIYLKNSLNEISLDDVVSNSNNYGIYMSGVNDFYMNNIVTAVNTYHGLAITNTTEGRLNNIKAWYNGSHDNSCYNIFLSTCNALMLNNIGCQESYYSNMKVYYSKDISINNCYLSKPNLYKTEVGYQIVYEGNTRCNINAQTANIKNEGEYFNKLIRFQNVNKDCDINIQCEADFPINKKVQIDDSAKGCAMELKNIINIDNNLCKYNKNYNYLINGDLDNQEDLSMLNSGQSYASWNNNKLRITSPENTQAGITFKSCAIPIMDNYCIYVKFKKISGNGRIVLDYTCYADVTEAAEVGTEYYISKDIIPSNLNARTNIGLVIPANMIIDIEEIGYVQGQSALLKTPMDKNAKI